MTMPNAVVDVTAHSRGVGQPDRHPSRVQPGGLELLDQRQDREHRGRRAGLGGGRQLGARPVRPVRARPRTATSRTATTRPARTSPTRPSARSACRCSPIPSPRARPRPPTRWSTPRSPCPAWWSASTSSGSRRWSAASRTRARWVSPADQVANLYLTPRLVAKLLTESYKGQFEEISAVKPASRYTWVQSNPARPCSPTPTSSSTTRSSRNLTTEQQVDAGTLAGGGGRIRRGLDPVEVGAVRPGGQGLARRDSRTRWGMKVNPLYSTSPATNPSGVAFGTPAPDNYPKSDPYCESLSGQEEPPIVTGSGADRKSSTPAHCASSTGRPTPRPWRRPPRTPSEANDQAKTTYSPTATPRSRHGRRTGPRSPGPTSS